jgi:oligoendopeptidase F
LFIGKFKKGLETISIDIAHHFEYLYNNDYTDLEHRENKYPVTMNIGLPSLNASFILNSIGKKGLNAITLCHEIGHAYQSYKSKNKIELSFEYMRPSNDVAEIQACSMEFFYYDQYQLLFENNTAIIQFSLFEKILFFIIKCCAYEELQRFVYDEKNITKSKMNNKWLSIRKEYYPYMTNEYFNNDTYYTEGNEWQENFQLFMNPFNEMSYTISYIHAIENWQKFTLNKNETIANYETLCSLGGSVSYKEALNILNLSGLNNESKLKDISLFIEKELNKLDLSINSF